MSEYLNVAIKTLALQWDVFNREIFGRSLKRPGFQLHSGRSRLGFWDAKKRLISISEDILNEEPWYRTLAVLKHEMLHQFIEESMGAQQVPPHGELFQSMRKKFSIEEFEDIGLSTGQYEDKHSAIIEKIRKLLRLAESEALGEAQNAMKMANQLMLKWNIEQNQLQERRAYQVRQLGKPGRIMLVHKMLSAIVRDFFFVETIWVQSYDVKKDKWGRVLEITGQKENVELAEYVYHYLLNLSEQLWEKHKSSNKGHRGNFLYGIMLGFYEKLEEEVRTDQVEDQALVWHGDPWLREFFEKRHPRRGQLQSSKMSLDSESLKAGKSQGRNIVINKGIKTNTGQKALENKGLKGYLS
jgi:hypothetical protein